MASPTDNNGIPFSLFVDLVQAIAKIKPRKASDKQTRTTRYVDTQSYKTFERWVKALRERYTPLPVDTTAIVFRFLFPEEDVQRKYGLQESRLAQHLTKILGVSSHRNGRGERLKNWKEGDDALGCLGNEVEAVMSATTHSQASTATVTLAQVDALLTELAAKCAFSGSTVHNSTSAAAPRRYREAILASLYTSLTPAECAVVTQIILKDLRPILYPIPPSATHYTAALLQYKSNAVAVLTKAGAMHAWDPSGRMAVICRSRANLEDSARGFEQLQSGHELPQPTFGTRVQIPKCVKGQGPAHCLHQLRGAPKVWVETKYDGERAQIHVRLDEDGTSRVKIFSKSGRDSTLDRIAIHGVIRDALGISQLDQSVGKGKATYHGAPTFKRNIIVEAEMVAFSDVLNRIDEFWRIRSLIGTTAIGVRHRSLVPITSSQDATGTQCSLISNASDGGTRHLGLVFFDILLLDDISLLSFPYSERRALLEKAVRVIPRYSMLAERICIDMRQPDAPECLGKVLAKLIADREEGAVLKADGAQYCESKWPWVKMKKDYIDRYGDAIDVVLLGACWEKERAHELRVPPTAYTTFYLGALANADALEADPSCRPHFEVIFTSSYGLSREGLEELNFMIKSSDPVPCHGLVASSLSYSYKLSPGLSVPTVFLPKPFLAEVFGAGFTKARGNVYYELRFPRISKIFRQSERPWIDGASLSEFQAIARVVVGRERPGKAEDDCTRAMFHPDEPASPGVRCPKKRKQTEALWIEKLEAVDKKAGGKGGSNKRARVQVAEARRTTTDIQDVENVGRSEAAPDAGSKDDELLRSRAGLSRLVSVTNTATSHAPAARPPTGPTGIVAPLASAQYPATYVNDAPASAIGVSPSLRVVATSSALPCSPLNLRNLGSDIRIECIQPSVSKPSPNPVNDARPRTPPTQDIPDNRECKTAPVTPQSAPPPPQTLHQFLQDSAVFLARAAGSPRPSWRAPSHAVVPTGNQVHTLDAVLLACGWEDSEGTSNSTSCSWSSRGVVFVDDSEGGRAHVSRTLGELAARRTGLLAGGKEGRCKPVLVFSMMMLAYDALEMGLTKEELEGRAICRFG